MIDVRGLRYTYSSTDQPALRGLDFSVKDGEVFGFLGPSGEGKTTTQKMLIGLLDDYSGEATVFDREVREWGRALYERIGMSAETPNLYRKLTGREILELFASLHGGFVHDATDLFERVGLVDAADRRVETYSKGMQMRPNFIRALVHDPELVFIDEPTAGIDPSNARAVRTVIEDLQDDGTTVFLTTHDMTVADQLCNRVAFIIDGQISVIDTPWTLKLEHGTPTVRVEYRTDGTLDEQQFSLTDLGEDTKFQRLIRSGQIETIYTDEATLEDVFVELTGTKLT